MASMLRAKSLRSGEALRGDLCAASGSQLPRGWPEPTLNRLLDFADVPKDARDPLGFKQALTEIAPALGGLPLRARKEMLTALAAHASAARAAAVPDRFGEWPPPEPTPPPRPRKKEEPRADPTAGDGGGYRWTQSETDLTIAVAVPDGTTKSEVLLQLAPSHGPATRLVLRARFWPQPLVAGELHAEVEASECMWHLSADTHEIVIDLPKVRPSLWPAILAPLPAIASKPAPPPVAGGVPRAVAEGAPLPAARLDVQRMGLVVQRMGQRPRDLATLRECIAAIEANIDPASPAAAEAAAAQTAVRAAGGGGGDGGADAGSAVAVSAKEAADGAVVAALNARAVPLLLRAVRMHGQLREVTADAWRLLCSLMRGRGFVKKIAADGGAMGLLLPALRSHLRDAPTAAQLVLAVRMLLPAVPPKPFVLDGGVETLCDAVRLHPTGAVAGVGVRALQMLASLNDVVRASVLEAEVLRKLLAAIETVGARADADADGGASAAEEAALVGPAVGLVAQLARGDAPLLARLRLQAPAAEVLRLCVRQAGSEEVQADGARALASLISDAASAAELVDGGGLAHFEAAAARQADAGAAAEEEGGMSHSLVTLLEGCAVLLSRELGLPPPDDVEAYSDEGVGGMASLVRGLVKQRAEREAAEAAREAAEAEEAAAAAAAAAEAAAKLAEARLTEEERCERGLPPATSDASPYATAAFGGSEALAADALADGAKGAPAPVEDEDERDGAGEEPAAAGSGMEQLD